MSDAVVDRIFKKSFSYMNKLFLSVELKAAVLPVTVGFVHVLLLLVAMGTGGNTYKASTVGTPYS